MLFRETTVAGKLINVTFERSTTDLLIDFTNVKLIQDGMWPEELNQEVRELRSFVAVVWSRRGIGASSESIPHDIGST